MERIVLFDGVCNFCCSSVNFIIRHDPEKRFKFAPLQSDAAKELKAKHDIGDDVDSIVLVEDGKAYTHSAAALRIARGLGGFWSIGYAFVVVPATLRDWLYRKFAKYRYRIFGKRDECLVPTPDVRSRFLA